MNACRSHREELDEILENPNDFHDKMMRAVKSNDFCSSLLSQIDEWHIFPIKKMTQARQQAIRLLDFKWIKLKTFSAELIH
jgi:SRSO17 transposase